METMDVLLQTHLLLASEVSVLQQLSVQPEQELEWKLACTACLEWSILRSGPTSAKRIY